MKKFIFVMSVILGISFSANAADGMITIESKLGFSETTNKLENILNAKGMTIFNKISHSKNASNVGIELRDTQLFIFGNPKAGSPLMKCQQSIAIDLPQKAVIWKDKDNKVWLSYNDMRFLEKRHDVKNCEKVISKVEGILKKLMTAATSK